ncbi:MAG: CvpA family protein [Lachnospiraceae bacterium]|nr:CvpA family protein [Lachnospiraceae bacterium]
MNILEIIVVVVTIALILSGLHAGFVKKLASMLSLVISIALVSAILPYVTDFIKNNTPLYDYIVEQCENVAAEQLSGLWTSSGTGSSGSSSGSVTGSLGRAGGTYDSESGISKIALVSLDEANLTDTMVRIGSLSASDLDGEDSSILSDLTREEVKALMEQYGYGAYTSIVDTLTDEEFEQYKEEYLEQYASQLQSENSGSTGSVGSIASDVISSLASSLTLDEDTQNEIIDSLPIPQVIKNMLIKNNNEEGYASLDVSTFQDYVIEYLATLILNVVSFLVAVLLVHIALRLLVMLLDILAHFPVVGFVNRLAGGALGILQALFALWLFFLILTVLQATDVGVTLLSMVEESVLLSWLYESNLFLRIVLMAAAVFA